MSSGKKRKERENDEVELTSSKIAKLLSSSQPDTRLKGVEDVESLLKSNQNLSEEDYKNLWDALFYCLWMCDKPNVQYELAKKISSFQNLVSMDDFILFIKVFYQTMIKKWDSIDKHRLDKYLWLIRHFVNESIFVLNKYKWDETLLDEYNNTLMQVPLNINSINTKRGLLFHITDVYVEEIRKVLGNNFYEVVDIEIAFKLFIPFLNSIIYTVDKTITKKFDKEIMEELLAHIVDLDSEIEESDENKKSIIEQKNKYVEFLYRIRDYLLEHSESESTPQKNRSILKSMSKTIELNINSDE